MIVDDSRIVAALISVAGALLVWGITRLVAQRAAHAVQQARIYKTDVEVATEIREELRRELADMKAVEQAREDRERALERKIQECEEGRRYQDGIITTLRELAKHQMTQINALAREQGALQQEIQTTRDALEAYRRARGSRATDP